MCKFFPLSLKEILMLFWFKNWITTTMVSSSSFQHHFKALCLWCVCVCVYARASVCDTHIHISAWLDAVVDKWKSGGAKDSGCSWPADSGSEPKLNASLPYTFCPHEIVWSRKSMTYPDKGFLMFTPTQTEQKRANLSEIINSKSVASW